MLLGVIAHEHMYSIHGIILLRILDCYVPYVANRPAMYSESLLLCEQPQVFTNTWKSNVIMLLCEQPQVFTNTWKRNVIIFCANTPRTDILEEKQAEKNCHYGEKNDCTFGIYLYIPF